MAARRIYLRIIGQNINVRNERVYRCNHPHREEDRVTNVDEAGKRDEVKGSLKQTDYISFKPRYTILRSRERRNFSKHYSHPWNCDGIPMGNQWHGSPRKPTDGMEASWMLRESNVTIFHLDEPFSVRLSPRRTSNTGISGVEKMPPDRVRRR